MNPTQRFRKTPKGVLTNLYSKMKERNIKRGFGELPFSLKELQERFLGDDNYIKQFNIWVQNSYKKEYKPSFDRINPNRGYTIDNMQILSWGENRKKADWEKSFLYTTPVVMCDINENIVRIFESTKEACTMTGFPQSTITMCCQGKLRSVKGYIFKYRGDKFRCKKSYDNPKLLEVER